MIIVETTTTCFIDIRSGDDAVSLVPSCPGGVGGIMGTNVTIVEGLVGWIERGGICRREGNVAVQIEVS